MLLAEREKQLIILENDNVSTVIRDDYNELRYKEFGGNRIFYKFADGMEVAETYDKRIFNCMYSGKTINVRDGNKVAKAIKEHQKTGNSEVFINTFKQEFYEENKREIIYEFLGKFGDRIKMTKNMYVIDDMFAVDNSGTSYFLDEYNKWKFLCTVAQGHLRDMVIRTEVGEIQLDQTALTIIAKIIFFINPNTEDSIFMRQLPVNTQKFLRENAKGEKKR